ncbi:hypothetical protein Nmel_009863 [Mimus melanotis]
MHLQICNTCNTLTSRARSKYIESREEISSVKV